MNDLTFYMFRLTVHEKTIPDMFSENLTKQEFLKQLLFHLQSFEPKQAIFWHIGNFEELADDAIYFRFGRVLKKKISNLDEKGDFVDNDINLAKYSHCVVDFNLQFLTISFNSNLSPSIISIGRALEKLLNTASADFPNYESIEVRIIPDYKEFLIRIKESYSVNRFWIKIRKPNPFDLDKDFIKPLSKLNSEMNSNEVKVELAGEDLDKTNIETLTESTTLAGSEGGAYIQEDEESKQTYINLGKNNLSFSSEFDDSKEKKEELLKKLRQNYKTIRDNFSKDNG